MGFFGEMFGGGRSHESQIDSKKNESESGLRKVSINERIHRDFNYINNDWHLNDLWIKGEQEDTLPGLSFDYIIDDDKITELFEDFPFPTKIRKQNDGRYFCTTFVNEQDVANVDDILYKKYIELINKPDTLDQTTEAA